MARGDRAGRPDPHVARDGRPEEVLTEDDESIRMPELTVYPKEPINFISITAKVITGDTTDGQ